MPVPANGAASAAGTVAVRDNVAPAAGATLHDVPVRGGTLRVAQAGSGPITVLAVHGVTASWMALVPLARQLGPQYTVLMPDLRGRGASADLPGPFGMGMHAEDCAAVLREAGTGPAVVVGASMGGYVAVTLATRHPELVAAVLLADGGLPSLPDPDGAGPAGDPVRIATAVLHPALGRLSMTYASHEAYAAGWREHPALAAHWSADLAAYVDYDLTGAPPALRSRVSATAVESDTRDLITIAPAYRAALTALHCPISLVRAPRGLLDEPEPLLSDALVSSWRGRLPQLQTHTVPDTNHYTLTFSPPGAAAVAAEVDLLAERARDAASPPRASVSIRDRTDASARSTA